MIEDSPSDTRGVAIRYCAGILIAGLSILARRALDPVLGEQFRFITFFPGSMLAAWFGGLGPGLLAVAMCSTASIWIPRQHAVAVSHPAPLLGVVLYAGFSAVLIALVTAERRASRRLQRSDKRIRAVLESISDIVYTLDHQFRFAYLNRQAYAYFSRSFQDLVGRTIWEVFPEKRGTVFDQSFSHVMSAGVPARFEALSPVTHKWVDVNVYPADGGLSVFERDLSERRAVALGEERMKAILNSASDAIITIDASERITLFSAGAEEIFRCRAADAIGKPIDVFIPERFRADHHRFIRTFGDTGVTQRQMGGERRVVAMRADGGEFPMEARISQTGTGNEKLYTVILRDVTERQRADEERERLLERARRAAIEAERANQAKDNFLAMVSHELRTPLTPILTWAHMLRTKTLSEDSLHRAAATIERAAKSQAQLIEDLLDISRIIAGKIRLDVHRMDLVPVIQSAIESLRPAAEAKGIRVQTILDPRAGFVSADRERIQQIVWNLLSNAIKFTPKGGRVQVVLQRISSHLEIIVSDSGAGISPAFLPYVFDRFRQDDTTTTRSQGGLGLGLAIVRHLTELHGGTVQCTSEGVGGGAVFTVKLPLAPIQAAPAEDEVHPTADADAEVADVTIPPVLGGIRVLVVDDERDTLETVAMVLAEAGAEVRTAPSASRALEAFQQWKADVLISDLGMPDEDGYSLIQRVRALPPEQGGRTPAVALTAYARVEDRLRVLNAGFQMHVPKPIEPSELIAVVSSVSAVVIRN